jgi:type I restriction enzyme S subunit
MQQIFSQQLRFKDDNDNYYPDWQTKKLGDIGYFQTSSVDKLFKEDETEVYLFNYMDVYKKKIITNKTIRVLNKTTAKDSQIKNNNLKKGDILFTPSSETPDDIGHSVVIMEDLNNCVYSYHVLRFRPTLELDLGYSNYCCNNNFVLQQFSQNCTGSTRFTLSLKSFSNTIIHLPILEEQTKIANLLTSIDDEIERLKQMLAELKLQKQSLMQKLLTGQIRVRN